MRVPGRGGGWVKQVPGIRNRTCAERRVTSEGRLHIVHLKLVSQGLYRLGSKLHRIYDSCLPIFSRFKYFTKLEK